MQTKEELNLADTIKGEINRMCVTNDIAELDTMALHARKNIERLQSLRYASITDDTPQADIHGLTDCDFCKGKNCEDCEGGKDEPQTGGD